jgi:hypothetical protein
MVGGAGESTFLATRARISSLALHGHLEHLKLAALVLGFHLTPDRLSVMEVFEILHLFLCLKCCETMTGLKQKYL